MTSVGMIVQVKMLKVVVIDLERIEWQNSWQRQESSGVLISFKVTNR